MGCSGSAAAGAQQRPGPPVKLNAPMRTLGRRAELMVGDARRAGLVYDAFNRGWDIKMNRDGVYPEVAADAQTTIWESPSGARVIVPPGYDVDTMFAGVSSTFRCGLFDERVQRLDASTSFQVSFGADGRISGNAGLEMKKLVGEGQGQIAYEFFLPCARMTRQSHVDQKNFDWVSEIMLGAQVQGFLSVDYLQDQSRSAGASLSVGVDGGAMSAEVNGSLGLHSVSAPKCVSNNVKQDGGVRLQTAQWESKDLGEVFTHLDRTWAEETLRRPDTWQVAMIKVEEGKQDQISVMNPHAVVLGRTGTGKSSFLNAFLGGRKNCAGEDVFITSKGAENEGRSCTKKPLSEVYELDAVAGDAHGDAQDVLTPFRLTDVPGLGAADLPDTKILADLFVKLGCDECRRVHAIVWVERFDEVRFSRDHFVALNDLEAHFGPKFWDLMVVVLTNFPYPKKNSPEKAKQDAMEMKNEHAMQMKKRIIEVMPNSEKVWGDKKNMFFCIDNLDAQVTDKELQDMEDAEKHLKEDDPEKGEAQRRRQSRDFAKSQLASLKLHMVGKTRHNQFWDSTERAEAVFTQPKDVVHLSELSGKQWPHFNHVHNFQTVSLMKPTWCDHCKSFLSGISSQGQRCADPDCGLTLCNFCSANASTYAPSTYVPSRSTAARSSQNGSWAPTVPAPSQSACSTYSK